MFYVTPPLTPPLEGSSGITKKQNAFLAVREEEESEAILLGWGDYVTANEPKATNVEAPFKAQVPEQAYRDVQCLAERVWRNKSDRAIAG